MDERIQKYEEKMKKDTGKPGERACYNPCRTCESAYS